MRRAVVVVCLCAFVLPLVGHADEVNDLLAPLAVSAPSDRYIVVMKEGQQLDGILADVQTKLNGKALQAYTHAIRGFSVTLPKALVKRLKDDPRVAGVYEDKVLSIAQFVSDDPTDLLPLGVNRINAENKANKGAGVEVAVIDTGIDVTHPDLKDNVLGGVNCVPNQTGYGDPHGHGTHVAGTIAARRNGRGVVGVAPEAKLWSVRVLDRNGNGTWSSIICGIDFVTSQASRIKVANLSLGGVGSDGSCDSDPLHRAICNSVNAGVTYVVAAGNDGGDVKQYVPATYDETIVVSALADSDGKMCAMGLKTSYARDDDFASFSNYATDTADLSRMIAAPGVGVLSTWPNNQYKQLSGTSMATPHVAGAAALYIAAHPGASPAEVKLALLSLGEPSPDFTGTCRTDIAHRLSARHPERVLRADSL